MSTFLRLLNEPDKAAALVVECNNYREGKSSPRIFEAEPKSFDAVPGKPFAYWVSDEVRSMFRTFPEFQSNSRVAQHGGSTKDDFRFLRIYWENSIIGAKWLLFAKGGAFSPFYSDVYLTVNWKDDAKELEAALLKKYPYLGETANWVLHRECKYLHPGLTWPLRTTKGLGFRILPTNCLFSHKGPAAFVENNDTENLLALLALTNSRAFSILVELQLAAADAAARSYEIGVIQNTPIPLLTEAQSKQLANLARLAWSLTRKADSVTETSHAFILPAALHAPKEFNPSLAPKTDIEEIHSVIDEIAFDLYGFAQGDRKAINGLVMIDEESEADEDSEEAETVVLSTDGLLSWAVGVGFGRFDLRIATGERPLPPEPEPFDPLPIKALGMLPDGAQPYHSYEAILVDEQGHPHDLVQLVEDVFSRVNVCAPDDVRRWLRKEFFTFHLKLYSKSRRKAPIYWPLGTASSSYTLWLYYPSLTSQTLYTAINDFVEPKLKQVGDDVTGLRNKGAARSREDEKQFESLQAFELELIELRDTLLKLAPTYKPNQDDGVQITAAPLWPLFRHKPWQKVLKDTWAKLEKGDYDWAHLAMNYWPDRVREKCKTDKSLAIAHGLENLYVELETKPKKARSKKKGE